MVNIGKDLGPIENNWEKTDISFMKFTLKHFSEVKLLKPKVTAIKSNFNIVIEYN